MALSPPNAAVTGPPEQNQAQGEAAASPPASLWDRPRFGHAARVVAPAQVGLEVGVELGATGEQGEVRLPEALIRVGVAPFLELRAILPSASITDLSEAPSPTSGGLGLKVGGDVTNGLGLSWVSTFDVPTQSDIVDLFASQHTLNILYAFSDTATLALAGQAALIQPLSGERNTLRWESGGAISFMGHLDASGFAFIEGYGLLDHQGQVRYGLGLGVSYEVQPFLNLDLGFDYGHGQEGNQVTLSLGVATLFH